jgi:hypothetical protein
VNTDGPILWQNTANSPGTADLPAAEVSKTYKPLWRVEFTFRKEKSTLEVYLQAKLEKKGVKTSWPDLVRDLSQLQAVRMDLDGNPYLIRIDFERNAYHAFKAAGVQPSSRVTTIS